MMGVTHAAAGVAAGTFLCMHLNLPAEQILPVAGVCVAGSLIPDIDVCTSKVGRLVAPASFLIQLFFGHRTIFHAPLLYAVLLGAGWIMLPNYGIYLAAAGIGILTHLLLDMLNHAGIPLFWPLSIRVRIPICKSGGIVDYLLFAALTVLAVFMTVKAFGIL